MGQVGAFIPVVGLDRQPPVAVQREAARRLERAGYRAAWTNEDVGGRDALVHASLLLAATDDLVLGTAVTTMWARAAEHLHAGAAHLAEAYPGRFVLGLGAGYPHQAARSGRAYEQPVAQLADYVARMSRTDLVSVAPDAPYPTVLAANGPRMFRLARQAADGAHPTMVPASHVARARELLGPDRLLVVGLTIVLDRSREAARAKGSEMLAAALSFPGSPYRANLVRLGYSNEELDTGAGRLVDDVLACGTPDDIAAAVRARLDAGADHVIVTAITGDFGVGVEALERVAPAVLG